MYEKYKNMVTFNRLDRFTEILYQIKLITVFIHINDPGAMHFSKKKGGGGL